MGIQIKNLKKSFGSPAVPILKGINEDIQSGEMISIVGRSGSGKSTLLYIISSLDRPSEGEVEIDGESLTSLSSERIHRFRNLNMGFVFQFHHLLPELTALENVLMPTLKTKTMDQKKSFALELLKEFDLDGKAHSYPGQLSGGEQQRVAIARALIMQPRYLFADEPTGNLDSQNGKNVMSLFSKINRALGTTIIFVTHDLEFSKVAQRQIHLVDGQIQNGDLRK